MIEKIVFGVFSFLIAYGVCYLTLFIPTKFLSNNGKRTITRRLISLVGATLIICFYFLYSPVKNNKTAKIRKNQNQWEVTLTSQRLLMVHDPFSALLRKTYTDTLQLNFEPKIGLVKGTEILTSDNNKLNGVLNVSLDELKVGFFYFNRVNGTRTPSNWNGKYKLEQDNVLTK